MRLRLFAIAVIVLAGTPAVAAATSCEPPEIEDAMEQAPSVFVGEVTTTGDRDRMAEMRVIAVWKGLDLPQTVTIWGTFDEGGPVASEDARFTVGRQYLVIPENTRQPFVATKCSASIQYRATGTVIPAAYHDVLGADVGRGPRLADGSAESTESADGTLAFGMAAAGLAASALGFAAKRRTGAKRAAMTEAPVDAIPKPESGSTRKHRLSAVGVLSRFTTHSGMKRAERNRKKSERLRLRHERKHSKPAGN